MPATPAVAPAPPGGAPHRRGPIAVGVAAATVLALVAVGVFVFRGREAEASYSLERAIERALEATDAIATIDVDVPGVGAATLDVRADGDTDRSALDVLVDGGLAGDLLGVPSVVSNPDGPLSLLVDHTDDSVYFDLSSIEVPGVPDGWLRLDLGPIAGFLGLDDIAADADGTEATETPESVWPMELAAAIAGAGTAEWTGEFEVDGLTVHRYRVEVPMSDLAPDELLRLLDELGAAVPGELDLPDTIAYDVDVAAGDQLRRIAASLDLAGVAVTASMDVEARDDVVVDLPDPDDVVDLGAVVAGLIEQAVAASGEALGEAGDALGGLGDLFGGALGDSGDLLGDLLAELWATLGDAWDGVAGELGDVLPDDLGSVGNLLDDVLGG
jgi:hypothetical protein